MSWETAVLTWSNWSLSYSEIVAYSDKIAVVTWIIVTLILVLSIHFFMNKKKNTLKESFIRIIPWICVVYVAVSLIKFLYDSRSDPKSIIIALIYLFCVWSFSTLFFWSIAYAKASMSWDKHPQRTAIKKSWPYWFVVLTIFSLINFIVWLIF